MLLISFSELIFIIVIRFSDEFRRIEGVNTVYKCSDEEVRE